MKVRYPFKELREILTLLELLKNSIELDEQGIETKKAKNGNVSNPVVRCNLPHYHQLISEHLDAKIASCGPHNN